MNFLVSSVMGVVVGFQGDRDGKVSGAGVGAVEGCSAGDTVG